MNQHLQYKAIVQHMKRLSTQKFKQRTLHQFFDTGHRATPGAAPATDDKDDGKVTFRDRVRAEGTLVPHPEGINSA